MSEGYEQKGEVGRILMEVCATLKSHDGVLSRDISQLILFLKPMFSNWVSIIYIVFSMVFEENHTYFLDRQASFKLSDNICDNVTLLIILLTITSAQTVWNEKMDIGELSRLGMQSHFLRGGRVAKAVDTK